MAKNKVADGRKFGTTVHRKVETSEAGLGIGQLESRRPGAGPTAELWLPPNGCDLPGGGARIYDPERCAALQAAGVERREALRRSEMTPAAIAAHNAAVNQDDDVGDEPPRFDDETAAPVTEPGAAR